MSDAETFADAVSDGWKRGQILSDGTGGIGFGSGMSALLEALDEMLDEDRQPLESLRLEFTLRDNLVFAVDPAQFVPYQRGWRIEFADASRLLLPEEVPTATIVSVGTAVESEQALPVTPRVGDAPTERVGPFPSEDLYPSEGLYPDYDTGYGGSLPIVAVDTGPALFEPISDRERSRIDDILAELWEAATNGDLNESQSAQVVAIAEMIRVARGDDQTDKQRWKLIAAVGAGLLWLAEKFPTAVINWMELIDKLNEAGYVDTAEQIQNALGIM